ncbi:hypothetical protein LINPERPRIM_LOCUS29028 [Linum perenne]
MRFWLYEYNIHDIYFSGMPYVYFNQALYAYEDYNPMFELVNTCFVPNNTNTYNATHFHQPLPKDPTLICFRNPSANNYILTEIRSCYANNVLARRINCQELPQYQVGTFGGPNGPDYLEKLLPQWVQHCGRSFSK